jgi:hypothetical protein
METHRAAWIAENGSIPEGLSVLHKCDVPACINLDHLFLGTNADNLADMAAKGRSCRGEKNGMAKITAADARAIYEAKGTYAEIGARFGLTFQGVHMIKRGKNWRHVTGAKGA